MLNHEVRRQGIGGSDVGTIMWHMRPKSRKHIHLFSHQTPLGVWDYIKYGVRGPDNNSLKNGRAKESIIIDDYEKINQLTLSRNDRIIDNVNPIFRGNVDARKEIIKLLFEAKTAWTCERWGKPGTSAIPASYLFQVLYYAAILNSQKIDVGVLFGDAKDVEYYPIDRNLKLESMIREICLEWWEKYIVGNKMPNPINQYDKDTYIDVARVHAPDKILTIYEKYKQLDKELSAAWKEKEKLKEEIKHWSKANMKGKSLLLFPDGQALGRLYFSSKSKWHEDKLKADGIDIAKYKTRTQTTCFKLK